MQLLYVTLLKINFPQNLRNLMKHAWSSAAAAAEPAHWHPPGSRTRCRGPPPGCLSLVLGTSSPGSKHLCTAPHCRRLNSHPRTGYRSPPRHKLSIPPLRELGIPISVSKNPPSPGNRHPPSLRAPVFGGSASSLSRGKAFVLSESKAFPFSGESAPRSPEDSIPLSSSQGAQHPHRTSPGAAARTESAARSFWDTTPAWHQAARPQPRPGHPSRGEPPSRHRTAHPAASGTASPSAAPGSAFSAPAPKFSPAGGPYRSG